jgi:hypothetical protein
MIAKNKDELANFLFFLVPFALLLMQAPDLIFYLESADHGYQLSLGRLTTLGSFPFVDLFFYYGPYTALTSAFGLLIRNSLVPETIICALGYGTSIFILHLIGNKYISRSAGILMPIIAFLLLARFYKWYYWLFPLLILWIVQLIGDSSGIRKLSLFVVAGILGGTAGLYRLDLGVFVIVFFQFICLLATRPFSIKRCLEHVIYFALGFLVAFFIWFIWLTLEGGNFYTYLAATLVGKQGIFAEWSIPLPSFDFQTPFSQISSHALALLVYAVSCIFCLVYGGYKLYQSYRFKADEVVMSDYLFPLSVGLLCLGLSPQGFYRADILHFLQIFPGGLLAVAFTLETLINPPKVRSVIFRRRYSRFLALFLASMTAISWWGIRDYGGIDLSRWGSPVVERYRQLDAGLDSDIQHPVANLTREVQLLTTPDERILVIPLACQIYYFSNRLMSGFNVGFAAGHIDTLSWRLRNLDMIRQNPPKVVISHLPFSEMPEDDSFRVRQPELYDYLKERYTQVVFQEADWLILARPES